MNVENIAGTAATGVLVFLGVVVAPQASAWGATLTVAVTLAAVVVAAAATCLLVRCGPAPRPARQLEYDAAWDHALAELGHDVA